MAYSDIVIVDYACCAHLRTVHGARHQSWSLRPFAEEWVLIPAPSRMCMVNSASCCSFDVPNFRPAAVRWMISPLSYCKGYIRNKEKTSLTFRRTIPFPGHAASGKSPTPYRIPWGMLGKNVTTLMTGTCQLARGLRSELPLHDRRACLDPIACVSRTDTITVFATSGVCYSLAHPHTSSAA